MTIESKIQDKINEVLKENEPFFNFAMLDPDEDSGYKEQWEKMRDEDWEMTFCEKVNTEKTTFLENLKECDGNYENYFFTETVGYANKELVESMDLNDLEKYTHRIFVEPFGDNFRAEVVTDPTDSQIVLIEFIMD